MELVKEEFMGSNDLSQIVKGRRTKRQWSSSFYKATMTTSSSSSGCGGDSSGKNETMAEEFGVTFSSTTTSSDHTYESTEEEEDMANCLILLAQGDGPRKVEKTCTSNSSASTKMEKFNPKKFSDFATSSPTMNKAGLYVYECKTCNRSFPSFQALGGHRASHKKPKPTLEEKRPSQNLPLVVASMNDITLIDSSFNKSSFPTPDLITQKGPTQGNNYKVNKVHECSICGSEFNSGQALGGHMRRHRANTGNNNQVTLSAIEATPGMDMNGQDLKMMKPRNVLPLDLNLPAPPEDDHYHHHHHQPKFGLGSNQQGLVLSAPALVDCHY